MSLRSVLWLGWLFVWRLVRRLFSRGAGLARFRAGYVDEDRLLPLSAEERGALAAFSGCVACGACDAAFDGYARVSRVTLRAPSDLPLAATRSLPDLDAARAVAAELEKGDLARLERVCPAHVPFRALVRFTKDHAERLAWGEPAPAMSAAASERKKHDPG
jgi:hypothetical protein